SRMASTMRAPVKAGSAALRRPRCHLSLVRWPSRSIWRGASMSAPVDAGIAAIGGDRLRREGDPLAGPEQVRMGHHGFEPRAVLEIEIDEAVGAVIGDPV